MRLIDADKFIKDETEAYMAVQIDLADGDGFSEAKRLVNEIVHRKILQPIHGGRWGGGPQRTGGTWATRFGKKL